MWLTPSAPDRLPKGSPLPRRRVRASRQAQAEAPRPLPLRRPPALRLRRRPAPLPHQGTSVLCVLCCRVCVCLYCARASTYDWFRSCYPSIRSKWLTSLTPQVRLRRTHNAHLAAHHLLHEKCPQRLTSLRASVRAADRAAAKDAGIASAGVLPLGGGQKRLDRGAARRAPHDARAARIVGAQAHTRSRAACV